MENQFVFVETFIKVTVNQASKLDRYPIPKIEDLLAKLAGGKRFTKLDMSQAYQQLVLDEESKKFASTRTEDSIVTIAYLLVYHRLQGFSNVSWRACSVAFLE